MLDQLTPKKLFAYISVKDDDISTAMANVLQSILNTVTSLEILTKEREVHEDNRKKNPSDRTLRPYPFMTEKISKGHSIPSNFLLLNVHSLDKDALNFCHSPYFKNAYYDK